MTAGGAEKRALDAPLYSLWSGRRDSDPRLSPWQGDTLPLSHSRNFDCFAIILNISAFVNSFSKKILFYFVMRLSFIYFGHFLELNPDFNRFSTFCASDRTHSVPDNGSFQLLCPGIYLPVVVLLRNGARHPYRAVAFHQHRVDFH